MHRFTNVEHQQNKCMLSRTCHLCVISYFISLLIKVNETNIAARHITEKLQTLS